MKTIRGTFYGITASFLILFPAAVCAASPLADMPAGAIDVHNHIVGPMAKYPMAATRTYTPPEASVAQLRALIRANLNRGRPISLPSARARAWPSFTFSLRSSFSISAYQLWIAQSKRPIAVLTGPV